jgi:SAM-dependent methyltransferase
MSADLKSHWEQVYRTKLPDSVSWYQASPEPSLAAFADFTADKTTPVVDIGAGTSLLVDRLLGLGWSDVTAVDIAATALAADKARLGPLAGRVSWIVADVTTWRPPRHYGVWHDRAVLHFLAEKAQRAAYREAVMAGTKPGSLVIVGAFAIDGPERCSGLPVHRYDAALLCELFGADFGLLRGWREVHRTPGGASQAFQWCAFRRLT